MGAKLLLSLGALLVTLFLIEGFFSLVVGRSLRQLLWPVPVPFDLRTQTDDERRTAALTSNGLLRVHPDPLVAYVFRSEADLEILGAAVRTDGLGMRARAGAPVSGDAVRIVVLGDSVAFGVGARNDETLAHRLEEVLRKARGPGAPPVVCRTVAVPGWNHRNAVHFLLDHLPEYEPDIVLYLPIGNDLSDSDGVWETGHRRTIHDLGAADPWLVVSVGAGYEFLAALGRRLLMSGVRLDGMDIGTMVVGADVTPESRRRYDENAGSIALLDRSLRSRGARLVLVQHSADTGTQRRRDNYFWLLRERLLEAVPSLPVVHLMRDVPARFTLPGDPHPNPEAFRVYAVWIARALLEREWISRGEGNPLPALAADVESLRARPRTAQEVRALAEAARDDARGRLRSAVDLESGLGVGQIYGGINPGGSAGARTLVALAPAGDRLRVRLAPLADCPDLYPLTVKVQVNGAEVGEVVVRAGGEEARDEVTLAVPPQPDPSAPFDVLLVPARWVAIVDEGTTRIASFRPIRIESFGR